MNKKLFANKWKFVYKLIKNCLQTNKKILQTNKKLFTN